MKNNKNAVVNKVCHSRGMLSGISLIRNRKKTENFCLKTTWQMEDPRQKPSGMTPLFITTHAFTLIELLVVVLIIGILAAVAVPQYKVAVDKSRLSTLTSLMTNIRNMQEIYYLENGKYSYPIENLDVDIPANCQIDAEDASLIECPYGKVDSISGRSTDPNAWMVTLNYPSSNSDILLKYYFARHPTKPNQIGCATYTEYGQKLCKTLAN